MISYSERFQLAYEAIKRADSFVDGGLDITYALDGFSVATDVCLVAGLNAKAEPYIGYLLLQSPDGHESVDVFVDDFVEIQQDIDGDLAVRYHRNSAEHMNPAGDFSVQDLTQTIPAHNNDVATNSAFQFIEDSLIAYLGA